MECTLTSRGATSVNKSVVSSQVKYDNFRRWIVVNNLIVKPEIMITPIEIRQQAFKKSMRGFDKEEVQNFLNTLSMEWEKLLEENKRLKTDLDKTKSNLENLQKVENVLHKTLLQAEQTSKSTIENAKKNAELKVQQAENRSNEILKKAMTEKSRMEMEINELISRRNEILQQLKVFLEAQSERIAKFEEKEMMRVSFADEPEEEEESASFFESSMETGSESNIVNDIVDEL